MPDLEVGVWQFRPGTVWAARPVRGLVFALSGGQTFCLVIDRAWNRLLEVDGWHRHQDSPQPLRALVDWCEAYPPGENLVAYQYTGYTLEASEAFFDSLPPPVADELRRLLEEADLQPILGETADLARGRARQSIRLLHTPLKWRSWLSEWVSGTPEGMHPDDFLARMFKLPVLRKDEARWHGLTRCIFPAARGHECR